VAYLLNGAKISEAVFTRALLALGEEGWLRIEPEDAGLPVVRINRLLAPGELRPFEQLALERVVRRMGAAADVPLSALTSDEGDDYAPWWKRFGEAVLAQAREAGAVKRGVLKVVARVFPFGISIAAGLAAAVAARQVLVGFGVGATVFLTAGIAMAVIDRPRLTDEGKAAVQWWRQHGGGFDGVVIADRVPAGASPAPNTPESLAAQGSAPLPEGYVWSSYGGRWRTIKVGSLDGLSWGKPGTAVMLGAFGAVFTLPATVVGRLLIHGGIGTLVSGAPLTVCAALIFGLWLPANRRSAAVPAHAEFIGQVVKRWTYEITGEDRRTHYCVCIDDGTSPEGWSFRIKRAFYYRLNVGDMVSVTVNPRWHKLKQLVPASPAPAADPGPRV
jgi:hypothetical protein